MTRSPRSYPRAGATDWANVSYFPNDNLAKAIVMAWSDKSYEGELLTYGSGVVQDWTVIPDSELIQMMIKTSGALAKVDVYLNAAVVLTMDQYTSYLSQYATTPNPLVQFLFVLPDPVGRAPSLATAQIAMAVHPCGI